MGIEYSPSRQRRVWRARKKEEGRWTSKSSAVTFRNVFDDEKELVHAILTVATEENLFSMESLTRHLNERGSALTAAEVRSLLRSWVEEAGIWARVHPRLCIAEIAPDTYRVLTAWIPRSVSDPDSKFTITNGKQKKALK